MTIPQILIDLLQLLFDMAVPAAMCTMVLAGLALRQEGGVNFEVGGRFQRWMLWSVILLTLPQFLSWFAAQGITVPPQSGGISGPWFKSMETSFTSFVSDVVIGKLVPVLAAFFVLKAALDAAQGSSPLGSVVAAIFLLTISGTVKLMQGFNSGGEFATTDMLASLWNYLVGNHSAGSRGPGGSRRGHQLFAEEAVHAAGVLGIGVPECYGVVEACPGNGQVKQRSEVILMFEQGLLNLTN